MNRPNYIERSHPLWAEIFNNIPSELPSGSEKKILTFSQRAFIADRLFEKLSASQGKAQ